MIVDQLETPPNTSMPTTRARARAENADTMRALLGFELVTERRARGITQQALAVALGSDRATVSRWEHGRCIPGPHHLLALLSWFRQAAA
jgi:DNA-binding transcriptional regulator YiaG